MYNEWDRTVMRTIVQDALSSVISDIQSASIAQYITKTCPCNEDPLTPHLYIVKLGFTGVYIIFLFLL